MNLKTVKDTRGKIREDSILDVEPLDPITKKTHRNPGGRVTSQGRPLSETYNRNTR